MALRRRSRDSHPSSYSPAGARPVRRRGDSRRRELVDAISSGLLQVTGEPITDVISGSFAGLDAVLQLPGADLAEEAPSIRSRLPATRAMLAAMDDQDVEALNRHLVEGIRPLAADHELLRAGTKAFVAVAVDQRFVACEEFLNTVKDTVRLSGLDAGQLLLSIDANPGFEPIWSKLQRLKSHGVRVAVHNFALASSSTEILRRYPIDVVRFGLASVAEPSDTDHSLLISTVKLARNLGCTTIADDVKDDEQLAPLRSAACDLAHGYVAEHD